jgi:hypothetical protein
VDYRKLLGKVETMVLPYFGGPAVDAPDRRLRLAPRVPTDQPLAVGWWRFEVRGRTARPVEGAEPEALDALPSVRGHLVGDRLVHGGALVETVHFMPEEEPPLLSPCRARRWATGELVFDALELEGDAEESVRNALEQGTSLAGQKGIAASLRSAFGMALLQAASRRLGIPISPAEVRAHTLAVADAERGSAAAEEVLQRLDEERREHARRVAERRARFDAQQSAEQLAAEHGRRLAEMRRSGARAVADAALRAEQALDGSGARYVSSRRMTDDNIEVVFRFMGERFVSVVHAATLQVMDAGICLAGADRQVTLDSLPGVIREAIDTQRLVITRR